MHTGMPKSQKIVKNGLIAKNHPRRAKQALGRGGIQVVGHLSTPRWLDQSG